MEGKTFFDSDVLVKAHGRKPSKQRLACQQCIEFAWKNRSGVISTTVLKEFYDGLRTSASTKYAANTAKACIEDYLSWQVVVDDVTTIIEAINMNESSDLPTSISVIVQAASVGGAATIYSYRVPLDIEIAHIQIVRPTYLKP